MRLAELRLPIASAFVRVFLTTLTFEYAWVRREVYPITAAAKHAGRHRHEQVRAGSSG